VRSKLISIAALALALAIALVIAPLGSGVAATGTSNSIAPCALGGGDTGARERICAGA
jgi:hypothetical protein